MKTTTYSITKKKPQKTNTAKNGNAGSKTENTRNIYSGNGRRTPLTNNTKKAGTPERPRAFASGAVKHVEDKANPLPDGDEPDHGGHDHRQKAQDFFEDTGKHVSGNDGRQLSGSRSDFLQTDLLSCRIR